MTAIPVRNGAMVSPRWRYLSCAVCNGQGIVTGVDTVNRAKEFRVMCQMCDGTGKRSLSADILWAIVRDVPQLALVYRHGVRVGDDGLYAAYIGSVDLVGAVVIGMPPFIRRNTIGYEYSDQGILESAANLLGVSMHLARGIRDGWDGNTTAQSRIAEECANNSDFARGLSIGIDVRRRLEIRKGTYE